MHGLFFIRMLYGLFLNSPHESRTRWPCSTSLNMTMPCGANSSRHGIKLTYLVTRHTEGECCLLLGVSSLRALSQLTVATAFLAGRRLYDKPQQETLHLRLHPEFLTHISSFQPEKKCPAVAIKHDKNTDFSLVSPYLLLCNRLTSEILILLFVYPVVIFGPVSILEQ